MLNALIHPHVSDLWHLFLVAFELCMNIDNAVLFVSIAI